MNDLEKLEAHFRSEAEKHEATPPTFIWDEINKELPRKKKNNKRLFFWIFLGLLICTIAFLQRDKFSPIKNNHSNTKISDRGVTKNSTTINSHSENTTSAVPNEVIQEIKILNDTNENTILHDESLIHNSIQNSIHNARKSNHLDSSTNPISFDLSSNATKLQNKKSNLFVQSKTSGAHQSMNSLESKVDSKKGIENNKLVQQMNMQNHSETILDRLPLLQTPDLLVKNRYIPVLSIAYKLDQNFESPDVESEISGFFFEINSLVGAHDKDLRTELSVDSFFRRSTESNWYTWGAKARIGYQLSNSLFVKTGIDFIESRNKFEFRGQFLLPSSAQLSSTALRFFSVGDLTYRQWNIPLTIGLEKSKGKFIYGVEGTLLLNLSFKAEGKIQTGLTSVSRVENFEIYKSSLGLGYNGALIFGTKINKLNTLYLRPTYSRYVSSINTDNANVAGNLSQYYLEFGFRRKLN